MKRVICYFIFLGTVCACGSKVQTGDLPVIEYDPSKMEKFFDISELIDTADFRIIPLETTEESLLRDITNIYHVDHKIIVCDKIVHKKVFVFDENGRYLNSVGKVGQGPEEYPAFEVSDIILADGKIAVYLNGLHKVLRYSLDGNYIDTITLPDFWSDNMEYANGRYYFASSYFASKAGNYNFYVVDKYNNLSKLNPYSEQDKLVNRGWGVNRQLSVHGNKALYHIATVDTIFRYDPAKGSFPLYKLEITERKIPESLAKGEGSVAFYESIRNNYITGMKRLIETKNHIVILMDGDATLVYDKNKNELRSNSLFLGINDLGNLASFTLAGGNSTQINDKEIIFTKDMRDGSYLKNKYKEAPPKSSSFATAYLKALENATDEDNPWVVILKNKGL